MKHRDSDRKVGCGEHRAPSAHYLLAQRGKLIVPPGCADYDWTFRQEARPDVVRCGVGRREVDGDLSVAERFASDRVRRSVRTIDFGDDATAVGRRERGESLTHATHPHERDANLVHASPPWPKNASWRRCMAGCTCAPSTTTVRLMPLELSESMYTRKSPMASSARDMAEPPSLSPFPTMETIPRFPSIVTSPSVCTSTTSPSTPLPSSMVTDTLTSDVATTSTDVRCRSNTSKIERMKPSVTSMRGLRTLSSVTPLFPAMALTGRRGASNVMSVPLPCGLPELSTHTGMPRVTAGAMVFGCRTFPPNDVSSLAPSKPQRSL